MRREGRPTASPLFTTFPFRGEKRLRIPLQMTHNRRCPQLRRSKLSKRNRRFRIRMRLTYPTKSKNKLNAPLGSKRIGSRHRITKSLQRARRYRIPCTAVRQDLEESG